MNSLTTLERPVAQLHAQTLLARDGFTCTLLTLAPDSESLLPESASAEAQLLFVVDGDIAVHDGGVTTIVNRGDTVLVPPHHIPAISARAGAPSRILRVEIPPRQIVTPQLITPRS